MRGAKARVTGRGEQGGKGDRQHAEKTDFLFATVALLHATWKFCVNNNATCRLKTAEQQNARGTRDGTGRGATGAALLKNYLIITVFACWRAWVVA